MLDTGADSIEAEPSRDGLGREMASRGAVAQLAVRIPPQQNTRSSVAIPHEWTPPAFKTLNVWPVATARGLGRSTMVPSPRRPSSFSPQQYALPAEVSPQTWKFFPLIRVNLWPPPTFTGNSRRPTARLPMPNCPLRLEPQQ